MNLLVPVRIALRALRVNTLRSLLTVLGIIIGVGSVITVIGVGAGARARVQEQLAALGANVIMLWPGSHTVAGARLGGHTRPSLTEDDAAALQAEVPAVVASAPIIRSTEQVVFGNTNWSTPVFGSTPEYFVVREWDVSEGRTFTAEEGHGGAKVAVLGRSVAQALFGDSDPVGQTIRVKRVPFTVIGVLGPKGQNQWGQDQDDIVLVPIRTARTRLFGGTPGRVRTLWSITLKVQEGADMHQAEEEIRALLRQRHRLPPGREDDFLMRNLSEVLQAQEQSSAVLTWLLATIASVSLLVGGIGIMNIMLVSVTERTREIGLRLAVGARARDILTQFLVEAVTLSLVGALLGILLGLAAAQLLGELAGWRIEVEAASIALAVGFAAAIGVFFGFYPARKASRLAPIDALRFE